MSNAARKIFISYRRDDHPDFVERIRDWFIQRYGRANVFMDFDSIPPFTRFVSFIQEKVDETDVMVVIIGPRWLELLKERAASHQDDFVRIEIRMALQKDKLVAPICIKGAGVPPRRALPSDLQPLLDHNIAFLNSGSAFLDNIEKIVDAVEQEWVRRNKTFLESEAQQYFNSAEEKFQKGDFSGAIIDVDQAIRLNPQFAEAYSRRAGAKFNIGDYGGAVADADQAVRLNPHYAGAYNNRGIARKARGDLEGAIADYTQAIHLNTDYTDAYYNRGIAREKKGDLKGAMADYQQYLDLGGGRRDGDQAKVEGWIQDLKKKL